MDSGIDIYTLIIQKRDEILSFAERRGARNIRIFGSAARSEARGDSDIDPDRSLLDVGGRAMDILARLKGMLYPADATTVPEYGKGYMSTGRVIF